MLSFKKLGNYCSYYSRWFWRCNHTRFLVCCAIALVGFVLGILVAVGRESEALTINYLELMSRGAFSVFGMFFKQCLLTLLMFSLVFICVLNNKLMFIGYLILFFLGYNFGGSCVNVVVCNTMLGIIYIIIYLVPVCLITIIVIAILVCGIKGHLTQHGAYRPCTLTCRKAIKKLFKKFSAAYICTFIVYIPFIVIIPCIAQSIMFGAS